MSAREDHGNTPSRHLEIGVDPENEVLSEEMASGCCQKCNMAAEVDDFSDHSFEREIECKDGILRIKQAEVGDESCVVWDAALVLAKYLQAEHFCTKDRLENKQVIELGAGTGVVGLMAASCG